MSKLTLVEKLKEHLYKDHGLSRGHMGVIIMPFVTHRFVHEEGIGHREPHGEAAEGKDRV